jgi:hypothetical protein
LSGDFVAGRRTPTPHADVYPIEARIAESQIFQTGSPTRILSYDGHSPGPTILAEAGRAADVTRTCG